MVTGEQPITRSELREELQSILQYYATKEDLSDLKVELTKDIGNLETRLVKWIVGVQLWGIIALTAVVTSVIAIMKFLEG